MVGITRHPTILYFDNISVWYLTFSDLLISAVKHIATSHPFPAIKSVLKVKSYLTSVFFCKMRLPSKQTLALKPKWINGYQYFIAMQNIAMLCCIDFFFLCSSKQHIRQCCVFVCPASVLQAMAVLVCAEMYQVKRLQHLCEVCVCAYLQSMPSRELASTGISVVRLLRRAKVSEYQSIQCNIFLLKQSVNQQLP